MKRVIAIGGASSSLQKREDTIWQYTEAAAREHGLGYTEINSAGASRRALRRAMVEGLYNNVLIVAKSWGGYETTKLLDEFADLLPVASDPPFKRLAVLFVDAHGPWWNLAWGRKGRSEIKQSWRALASFSATFGAIYQFNRKPFGTRFLGADLDADLTGKKIYLPSAGGQALELADHFNIAHSAIFKSSLSAGVDFIK